jgi:prepilin-type N-terminal cleavage/methylation domain-containing protein
MNKKRAFTLVELLVVIAIIAMLLAILIPSLSKAKEKARQIVCASQEKQNGLGFVVYSSEYSGKIPLTLFMSGKSSYSPPVSVVGTSNTSQIHPSWSYDIFHVDPATPLTAKFPDYLIEERGKVDKVSYGNAWGMGALYITNIIKNAKTFYCPSASVPARRYDSYTQNHPWPWWFYDPEDPEKISKKVRSGYNYIPQGKPSLGLDYDGFPVFAKKMDQLDSTKIMALDNLTLEGLSHSAGGRKGVNAIMGDGSVDFKNETIAFNSKLWDNPSFAGGTVNNNQILFRTVIQALEGNTKRAEALAR